MTELLFSRQANSVLDELEKDPAKALLIGRMHTALDELEKNPGSVHRRRRRFANIGVWGIPVIANDEEWLILWDQPDEDSVVVRAIVPAP